MKESTFFKWVMVSVGTIIVCSVLLGALHFWLGGEVATIVFTSFVLVASLVFMACTFRLEPKGREPFEGIAIMIIALFFTMGAWCIQFPEKDTPSGSYGDGGSVRVIYQ